MSMGSDSFLKNMLATEFGQSQLAFLEPIDHFPAYATGYESSGIRTIGAYSQVGASGLADRVRVARSSNQHSSKVA